MSIETRLQRLEMKTAADDTFNLAGRLREARLRRLAGELCGEVWAGEVIGNSPLAQRIREARKRVETTALH
jgi:hypothetical protein